MTAEQRLQDEVYRLTIEQAMVGRRLLEAQKRLGEARMAQEPMPRVRESTPAARPG